MQYKDSRNDGKAKNEEDRKLRKKTYKTIEMKAIEENQRRKNTTFKPPGLPDFENGADNQGNGVFLGPGMNPATETPGHLHQVVQFQGRIRSGQCSPPGTESAPLLATRQVAVEHDAIDAVIAALQKLLVIRRQVIGFVSPEEPPRTPENPVPPLTGAKPTDSFLNPAG